jgi:hypothetical protein
MGFFDVLDSVTFFKELFNESSVGFISLIILSKTIDVNIFLRVPLGSLSLRFVISSSIVLKSLD